MQLGGILNFTDLLCNLWLISFGGYLFGGLGYSLFFVYKLWVKFFSFEVDFFLADVEMLIEFRFLFFVGKKLAVIAEHGVFLWLCDILISFFPKFFHPPVKFNVKLSADGGGGVRLFEMAGVVVILDSFFMFKGVGSFPQLMMHGLVGFSLHGLEGGIDIIVLGLVVAIVQSYDTFVFISEGDGMMSKIISFWESGFNKGSYAVFRRNFRYFLSFL